MEIKPEKIKKILCIKPRGIGDVVLSTVILENLRDYFKNSRIDYLTESFAAPALENNPMIHKILTMGNKEFPLKAAWKLRKEKYDMILDLWSNPRTALITFLSRVKYRVGFAYRGRKYAYNILATSHRGKHHSAEHNLELLKIIDVPIVSRNISYYLTREDYLKARNFIDKHVPTDKTIIGIIPSGGWPSKRCDAEKWVEICTRIAEKYNSVFLIIWGPGDENDAHYIKNQLPANAYLIPPTGLNEAAGYIFNCALILANDSGPMHISAAMGKPTLGIFGPTSPISHGPYSSNSGYVLKDDLFCIICNRTECPYNHECFRDLSVKTVISKLEELAYKNQIHIKPNEKSRNIL